METRKIQHCLCRRPCRQGGIKGALTIWHRHDFEPQKEWLDFFEALSVQIAIAISDAQLFEELQRANFGLTAAYDETVEGWVRTLDLRDRETENHILRVTEMTLEIARRIGLSAELLVHYRRGAILHDIGKIAFPDYIFFNPAPLKKQELAVMSQHPQLAYEILCPDQIPKTGSGYSLLTPREMERHRISSGAKG